MKIFDAGGYKNIFDVLTGPFLSGRARFLRRAAALGCVLKYACQVWLPAPALAADLGRSCPPRLIRPSYRFQLGLNWSQRSPWDAECVVDQQAQGA